MDFKTLGTNISTTFINSVPATGYREEGEGGVYEMTANEQNQVLDVINNNGSMLIDLFGTDGSDYSNLKISFEALESEVATNTSNLSTNTTNINSLSVELDNLTNDVESNTAFSEYVDSILINEMNYQDFNKTGNEDIITAGAPYISNGVLYLTLTSYQAQMSAGQNFILLTGDYKIKEGWEQFIRTQTTAFIVETDSSGLAVTLQTVYLEEGVATFTLFLPLEKREDV